MQYACEELFGYLNLARNTQISLADIKARPAAIPLIQVDLDKIYYYLDALATHVKTYINGTIKFQAASYWHTPKTMPAE